MNKTQKRIKESKKEQIEGLFTLLRIPSISADLKFKEEVLKCAQTLKQEFISIGLDNVALYPTKGHPLVYGEKILDSSLPTVLVYGHYDVQPPDPLDLWDTEPFAPTIKNTSIHPEGAIFARGACDDKGQFYMHVKALEAMLESGELPCNVKIMIEGEEEIGSEHLADFVKEHKDMLKADIILVSDTGMISNQTPSITTGLRGLSYLEIEVTGPNRDLHSGLYGGCVANPINVLSKMLASIQDENNKITIPGFYEDVLEISQEERKQMAQAPFSLENYCSALDISEVQGEKGFSTLERGSIRPSFDINGIWGGYTGEGAKTVIPSKAFAKVSMRLVPNQDPEKITNLFKTHFERIAPSSVRVHVKPHHGGEPAVTPMDHAGYQAASKAYEKTFGQVPIPMKSGGSIPIISMFEKELGIKSILMGFGLDSDAIHSPNEHFGLFNFYKGIETIPYFYKYFTELHS
jgi:acetylornithine deacetylase/succinyl-diaminopimelate desuccinylase-like protein